MLMLLVGARSDLCDDVGGGGGGHGAGGGVACGEAAVVGGCFGVGSVGS